MNLSLSGCGFLGIYHIGVASCFKEYAPHLVTGKIGGASAGAICACCFISGCCLGQCTSFILRLASKARSRSLGPLHPTFHVLQLVREGLKEILPTNAHEIASGRLFVSLTRVSDRKNVIASQFDSVDELLDALICSAWVPFYCGLVPPTFKGVRYVDGGLSDNLLVLDEHTVTVSPFAGESDICPADTSSNFLHITLANTSLQFTTSNLYRLSRALFPPHPEILSDMCKQGFDDALKFLQRNNLISCTRHLSIRTSITPVTPVSYTEEDTVDASTMCDDCDEFDCHDCTRKKQVALFDSLPPTVVSALKAACESMENGMLGYLWSTRPVKIASLLATPWVLPLDIFYNFTIRFLQWVPYMPQDIQLASGHLREGLKYLIHHINHHSKKYSAKFSCQVAISEVNYNQGEALIDLEDPDVSAYQPYPVVRNLNIGFAVNFETDSMSFPPSTSSALRQLEGKIDHLDIDKVNINSEGPGCSLTLHAEGQDLGNSRDNFLSCQEIFDTFDNCLEVSHQMESIMAFHYDSGRKDPRQSSMNVREVFNLNDMDIKVPALGAPAENDQSELTWDNYLEMEQEEGLDASIDSVDMPINFDLEVPSPNR